MASHKSITVSTSDNCANGDSLPANSPKGQCLCSPTTHRGSFRCRYHRTPTSGNTTSEWFKRSKSMPVNKHNNISPKSVEST
ncbi:hypothetical protein A4A49_22363 [Nicotiana attenuata]|uniref:Uncharacterized protein n=1 Tax=Nicotiana attenuata TaxID=49451 RepID=A0A314LCN2_NICAT|nr:hypothetical protein A4A49_22363 [Nicotiana attenuata]